MAFNDLIRHAYDTCLNVFGVQQEGITAVFTPQDYSGPQRINGIISPPPLEEQVIPGSMTGTSIVYFWVSTFDMLPVPKIGDTLTLDGVLYNLDKVNVDVYGGAMLHLRRSNA
ncbi:MAG TPA: hypothetical protein VGN17_03975 [Bryobacteraceae bacterium]|jgi:hypothetical protein